MLTSALLNSVEENLMLQTSVTENRKLSEVMLDLIEPVVESISQVADGKNAVEPLSDKLAEIKQRWASELEKTVDEEFEKAEVEQKLVIKNGSAMKRKESSGKIYTFFN
jgi:hypothetical protein